MSSFILAGGKFLWHSVALEYLCDHGADLSVRENFGRTLLHRAVRDHPYDTASFFKAEVLDVLLSRGADPNAVSEDHGETPLDEALKYNNSVEIIRKLLNAGARPDLGQYPTISTAITKASPAAIEALLEAGADCNAVYQRPDKYSKKDSIKETPFLRAAIPDYNGSVISNYRNGDPERQEEIVKLLLKRGADPTQKFRDNKTTVLHEIAHRSGFIRHILMKPGIDLEMKDDMGRTPLLLACEPDTSQLWLTGERSPENCALELIHAGANIHATDNKGSTALHNAVRSGFVRVVSHLLESGASITVKDYSGATPLFYALSCVTPPLVLEMVSLLRKKCTDIMRQTQYPGGKSPLHLLAPWLLELSQDPDPGDKLLHEESGYWESEEPERSWSQELADLQTLYQEFVDMGWSREVRDELGNTPIFSYVGKKPERLSYGSYLPGYVPADPNDTSKMFSTHDVMVVNQEGDTLLHAVAGRRRDGYENGGVSCELFKQLMEMRLDPRKENKKGLTPLDVAASRGNEHILEMFAKK